MCGIDAEVRADVADQARWKKNVREAGVTRPQVIQKGKQTPFAGLERVLVDEECILGTGGGGW
jgi:hypothetical protein